MVFVCLEYQTVAVPFRLLLVLSSGRIFAHSNGKCLQPGRSCRSELRAPPAVRRLEADVGGDFHI